MLFVSSWKISVNLQRQNGEIPTLDQPKQIHMVHLVFTTMAKHLKIILKLKTLSGIAQPNLLKRMIKKEIVKVKFTF